MKRTRKTNRYGFTLEEIIIVIAGIGLLAAIVIPSFAHARCPCLGNNCINNLRQIDGAKQEWALEMKKDSTCIPTVSELQPYMGRGSAGILPWCPQDKNKAFQTSYTVGMVKTNPVCNIGGTAGALAASGVTNHVLN